MDALRRFLGTNDMMAYLTMMAVRLVELKRVLKPTGSIYLRCDPTASHYLKLVMDAVFAPQNHRAEIVWRRTAAHSDAKQGSKQPGHVHDIIFFYTRGEDWTWSPVYTPHDASYVASHYRHVEEATGRRFRLDNLTAARPGGDTEYEWRIKRPVRDGGEWQHDLDEEYKTPKPGWEYKAVGPYSGRYWAFSRRNMESFAAEGRLRYTRTGTPEYKRYLDEMPGVPVTDLWADIPPINSQAAERLGYPTQKPEALLERIIQASSNEGDLVLDPFCGCGTTIAVAERLKRRWIGIDVTHIAITLMRNRLRDTFGPDLSPYEVIGDPKDVPSAQALAEHDRYQFEWWALGLVEARPAQDRKKGADSGIDGLLYFFDDNTGQARKIIVQVKSGKVSAPMISELGFVVEKEKAAIGAFLTLQEPTGPMVTQAASAGFYEAEAIGKKYPKIQILTIAELLAGKELQYPQQIVVTFKKAPRKAKRVHEEPEIEWGAEGVSDG